LAIQRSCKVSSIKTACILDSLFSEEISTSSRSLVARDTIIYYCRIRFELDEMFWCNPIAIIYVGRNQKILVIPFMYF